LAAATVIVVACNDALTIAETLVMFTEATAVSA